MCDRVSPIVGKGVFPIIQIAGAPRIGSLSWDPREVFISLKLHGAPFLAFRSHFLNFIISFASCSLPNGENVSQSV